MLEFERQLDDFNNSYHFTSTSQVQVWLSYTYQNQNVHILFIIQLLPLTKHKISDRTKYDLDNHSDILVKLHFLSITNSMEYAQLKHFPLHHSFLFKGIFIVTSHGKWQYHESTRLLAHSNEPTIQLEPTPQTQIINPFGQNPKHKHSINSSKHCAF